MPLSRRHALRLAASALLFASLGPAFADPLPDPADWPAVVAQAKGQTVQFHAWGGEPRINDYIGWVAGEVKARFGVMLQHVKVSDTASVVQTVLAEKAAGRSDGGAVDLVWINGENFAAMKEAGLLLPLDWATKLPAYAGVDVAAKPTVAVDFTVPTEGREAPWGMAKLVFLHDAARLAEPPKSVPALLDWAKSNPGRFTFPQPPDFLGSTFLKQALVALAPDPAVLARPVDDASFATVAQPLWSYLDALTPNLWRSGRAYPKDTGAMRQLLADGEIDIAFAFNPADATSAIANGELPDTVRSFVLDGGTIGNTHFVAIPFDANAKAGALVVADFLMSAEAQARKQDPAVWGDPTVLAVDRLPAPERARFASLDLGVATLAPEQLGPTLPEPHPSWMTRLETEWAKRYGVSQ